MESLDDIDRRIIDLLQGDGRLTGAEVGRRAARTSEVVSTVRVTGEDCLLFDIQCKDAARLESVVDSLARYGPVTTSLVLRDYPRKPLMPQPSTTLLTSEI
jgi:Lrp/AsnC family leucine-responsive transcriptional regulator